MTIEYTCPKVTAQLPQGQMGLANHLGLDFQAYPKRQMSLV